MRSRRNLLARDCGRGNQQAQMRESVFQPLGKRKHGEHLTYRHGMNPDRFFELNRTNFLRATRAEISIPCVPEYC